jgi:hypothetical protein
MFWAGHLEKLLEVIGRLSCLTFEATLCGGDVFFIEVISLSVIVAFIVASSNSDQLGAPLWPPLVAFASNLGRCPSATGGAHLPIALDKNGPDCLLTRGVSGGDVKQLLCGLQLITTKFMHKGLTISARPKCRDDVDVADLGEFVTLLGKLSDVMPEGLAQLLPATLQVLGVAQPHVCALEVVSEDLLEIVPGVNRVSEPVVKADPSRVG